MMLSRVLVVWVAVVFCGQGANSHAADRPNIVFILADDLGYGDVGCYGQATIKTPVIDTLAAEGIRFTQHYAGSTVCGPSRSVLMTGLDTGRTWLRHNGPHELRPDPDDLTVATLLKQAGYRTAMIGKSCVTGNTQNPKRALEKGFDVFYGTTNHVDGHHRYPRFVYDQTERVELHANTLQAGTAYDAELYTKRAEHFIQETTTPFFLLLSYPIPHAEFLAPEGATLDGAKSKGLSKAAAQYGGMVEALDGYVGRVLAALDAKGVSQNTVVIFTSDNGPDYDSGGLEPTSFHSGGPLRGGKRDLYEGGIRVPMIVRWPAGIPKPGTTDHVSGFCDFLPTACDLAGIDGPRDIDGISLLPTITGKGAQREHEFLYWEFHGKGTRRALRQGNWKLVHEDMEAGGQPQLFHLDRDVGESTDLAAQEPGRVASMLAVMKKHRMPSPVFPNKALDSLDQ